MKISELEDIKTQRRPRLKYEALRIKIKGQNLKNNQALVFTEDELHQILGTTRKSLAGKHMLATKLAMKLDMSVIYDGIQRQYVFYRAEGGKE